MQKSSFAMNLLAVIALIFILKAGSFILLPFVVALFLWVLIWVFDTAIEHEVVNRFRLPRFLLNFSSLFSIALIVWLFWLTVSTLWSQAHEIFASVLSYRESLPAIASNINERLRVNILPLAENIMPSDETLKNVFSRVLPATAGFVRSVGLVVIYLMFMLMERSSLEKKLPLVFKGALKIKKDAGKLLRNILSKVRTYLLLKSLSGLVTGLLSYALMSYVGLEFAGGWAVFIGVMNFIPTLGVIISSAGPIIYSLLQFGGAPAPFLTVLIGLSAIQFILGQLIEPRLMGKNVNISPLAQIVSIVLWGWIWGPVGMFLCIPIMIILSIVLYNIPSTKRIAILISEDGETI